MSNPTPSAIPEITDPLALLLTNAGVSAAKTALATSIVGAVPLVLNAGLAVGQALAPSISALRDVAATGRDPSAEEIASVLKHTQSNILELQRLADPPAPAPTDPPDPA